MLTQFLMGLGDHFTAIRGQILMMKPIPTLSQCYSMLLQEENQREISKYSHMNSGSVAMSVRYNNIGNKNVQGSKQPSGFKKN